jgi:hypothetical protein
MGAFDNAGAELMRAVPGNAHICPALPLNVCGRSVAALFSISLIRISKLCSCGFCLSCLPDSLTRMSLMLLPSKNQYSQKISTFAFRVEVNEKGLWSALELLVRAP